MNPRVLIATNNKQALTALYEQQRITVIEAMTTDGVQRNLSACHLAIVDVPALQAGSLSLDDLTAILNESDVPHIASIDFLANPQTHLDWVRRNAREGKSKRGFSPRVVALLSFAGSGGGIGKTTLALQAARRFRQKTGLPALVGEFCFGASGLSALTVEDAPHLYELLSNNEAPAQWKDISLAPLDYAMARLRRKQDYADWYGRQKRRHTLTILDITWPHDLFAGEDIIDQWLILAHAGRRDTIFSALRLKELLTGEGRKVDILVNFYHRGDGLFLSGVERIGEIPRRANASRLDGALGSYVLDAIYPNWSKSMEKRRWFGGRK